LRPPATPAWAGREPSLGGRRPGATERSRRREVNAMKIEIKKIENTRLTGCQIAGKLCDS
jgi:hypothetical protein